MNLNKFRHVWTCSDMFENHMNCNNLYHIEPEQVQTYFNMFKHVQTWLRIVWIMTICIILNLIKFRHVWTCSDMLENHMNCKNSYHIESEKLYTRLKIIQNILENLEDLDNLKNLDNWLLWTFCELTCCSRSILSRDLGLNSFESGLEESFLFQEILNT